MVFSSWKGVKNVAYAKSKLFRNEVFTFLECRKDETQLVIRDSDRCTPCNSRVRMQIEHRLMKGKKAKVLVPYVLRSFVYFLRLRILSKLA